MVIPRPIQDWTKQPT